MRAVANHEQSLDWSKTGERNRDLQLLQTISKPRSTALRTLDCVAFKTSTTRMTAHPHPQ